MIFLLSLWTATNLAFLSINIIEAHFNRRISILQVSMRANLKSWGEHNSEWAEENIANATSNAALAERVLFEYAAIQQDIIELEQARQELSDERQALLAKALLPESN